MKFPGGIELRRMSEEEVSAPQIPQADLRADVVEPEREMTQVVPDAKLGNPPKSAVGHEGSRYDRIDEQEETNPLLMGRLRFVTYQEMRRSDAAVRALLYLIKLPIKAAHWDIHPVSDDPLDKLVADACRWQFGIGDGYEDEGRLDLAWDEQLGQALLMLDFGAMFEEAVWAKPEDWIDADGDKHRLRPLARLAPRYPSTVAEEGIATDVATGLIQELKQDINAVKPIPGWLLNWYVHEREPPSWFGTSLLRPVFGPWRLKKALMVDSAIAWDRYSAGVPKVRYPRNQPGAEDQAKKIGREYRVHERAYVALEGPEPTPGTDGWDIDIISPSGAIADPIPLLRHYDEQIATGGLQMFSRLGVTETGSRAVGEVLADPYYLATESVAKQIARLKRRRDIRRFVDMNFGKEIPTPKLTVSKIQARNATSLVQNVTALQDAGAPILQRLEIVNDVLEEIGLPTIPEDEAQALVPEGQPPPELPPA